MSDCQSMPGRVPVGRYFVKRPSGIGRQYPAAMKEKARSEYGSRLYAARKRAGLTQVALAKAAGMSQSTLQEAETTGLKSTYTAQLAAACGVSPQWLATGEGSPDTTAPRPEADQVAHALEILTKTLQKADEDVRLSLEPLLSSMAREPDKAGNKSRLILRLLFTDTVRAIPTENDRPGHISGDLGILDLGDRDNGRSDRVATAGGRKR
jgi:transcriptional regulator with XRE-family HTH domain